MKKFALIGAAGYIAPRHMKAIKETGNDLIAILDPNDSVGIIDSFFPDAYYFSEFERFDRHLEKLKSNGDTIDFLSICSPNYLHDAHIRYGLKNGYNVICEKPIVLNPWNLENLIEIEKESKGIVNCILQLRLMKEFQKLKKQVDQDNSNKKYNIKLKYITSRGNWYLHSWKGDVKKSGGVSTNIGVHFFDILSWIFGQCENTKLESSSDKKAQGTLKLKKANVEWFLSIDYQDLPKDRKNKGKRTFRSFIIDDNEIEFSDGFEDLHTESYKNIIDGKGFGLSDAKKSIDIVSEIRS